MILFMHSSVSYPKRKQRKKVKCTTVRRKRSQKSTQKSRLIAVPLAEMIKWIIIIMLLVALTIAVDVAGIHERHIYKLAHQRWP